MPEDVSYPIVFGLLLLSPNFCRAAVTWEHPGDMFDSPSNEERHPQNVTQPPENGSSSPEEFFLFSRFPNL